MYRDEIDDILEQYFDRLLQLAACVVLFMALMWVGPRFKATLVKPLKNVEEVLDTVSKSSTRVAISSADTAIKEWQSSQD